MNPTGGNKFKYRLKQIDIDGKYAYSAEVEVALAPDEFTLYQNYPNPMNPTTTIRYRIPKVGNVTLKIFDMLGAEVATLVSKYQSEGNYEVNFNASELSSGVYLYQLRVNNFIATKKMILLK